MRPSSLFLTSCVALSHQQCRIGSVASAVSHRQCRIGSVASAVSPQQCRISRVASAVSHQPCHLSRVVSSVCHPKGGDKKKKKNPVVHYQEREKPKRGHRAILCSTGQAYPFSHGFLPSDPLHNSA
ncbi:hypothetical protein POVWA2_031220 [Plasmodium ovale wallikeri]|uniref:Uncharacterized protein n=1 Tax=Plasmodium ovale wallikeri TaxID=864142 RepID=A0A1A8YYG1_PLAOA|nr:hypothetical protein POVWA1_031500 [Plasmodium ovale wallikeri]SBT36643.1 hypothetical protein POVWA2_031220 [Plasmodium ovale wallikeri]